MQELNKRLDFDIDEILESPKLRLQLSPAELDKSLLELYNKITQGTGGDVARVIGGGGRVGLQNFYMKHVAAKQNRQNLQSGSELDLLPAFVEEVYAEEKDRTTTEWVQWALSRNLPSSKKAPSVHSRNAGTRNGNQPKMCLETGCTHPRLATWDGLRPPAPLLSRTRPTTRTNTFSTLI